MPLKGYAGVCRDCKTPHIHYGSIPKTCVSCGGRVELHGQITPLGILLPGLYHAVQDRRRFKRNNWEIYGPDAWPIGTVTNLVRLRRKGNTHMIQGVHDPYGFDNLDAFIENDKVSIRWFIINHPVDLEDL